MTDRESIGRSNMRDLTRGRYLCADGWIDTSKGPVVLQDLESRTRYDVLLCKTSDNSVVERLLVSVTHEVAWGFIRGYAEGHQAARPKPKAHRKGPARRALGDQWKNG